LCLSARNRKKAIGKELAVLLGLGAPDNVRCARTSLGEQAALGTRRRRTTTIHRTVRWCTGLFGESSAAKSSLSEKVQRRTAKIHRTVRWCNGLSGEPTDCPVSQRSTAQGQPRNPRATRGPLQRSAGGTGLFGVHRTVSGVPTTTNLQRSDAPEKEGDRAPDSYRDCPVAHRTVRCATQQKARLAFQDCLQRLLTALGL
jgi:hypothetical protein